MPLRVAVTGGIGSGKSTVSRALGALGAVVVDSDLLARSVVAPGTPGLAAVTERFGSGVLNAEGALDRAALAAVVFADPVARRDLEAITHPLVRAQFRELLLAAPAHTIVVNDIPILTTVDAAARFELVLGVRADTEVRVARLVTRGLTEPDARARIAAQIDDTARHPLIDVWLSNNGPQEALSSQVGRLWAERLRPFADNILAGRRAERVGPELQPWNPDWPVQAVRIGARVLEAAGDAGIVVEHIGSTAIPGMPSKDVLDLQLGVHSLSDVDGMESALRSAGFIRSSTAFSDTSSGLSDEQGQKVFFGNADPGRAVNLHARLVTGPAWRYALLFRDWMRADRAAAADYRQLKESTAARFAEHSSTAAYAAAKKTWFSVCWARAEAWADAAQWRVPDLSRRCNEPRGA